MTQNVFSWQKCGKYAQTRILQSYATEKVWLDNLTD